MFANKNVRYFPLWLVILSVNRSRPSSSEPNRAQLIAFVNGNAPESKHRYAHVRAARAVAAQHPFLALLFEESKRVATNDWRAWLKQWELELGDSVPLHPIKTAR